MDRTLEFKSFVNSNIQNQSQIENQIKNQRESQIKNQRESQRERKFYEDLYFQLMDISNKIRKTTSLKTILILDKELMEFIKKNTLILKNIKINNTPDVKANFEGINYILNMKMVEVSKQITLTKNRISSNSIELEPVKPTYKETNFKDNTGGDALMFEMENKKIVQITQYEETKQRLLKIEAVQRAIQENLLIQDERIDCIIDTNVSTNSIYGELLGDEDLYNGSFIKRCSFAILGCLTFVLIFTHIFHRK
jgi:hypothetical protein